MTDDFLPFSPMTGGSARDFLDRRGINHQDLSERDALHLGYVLTGFVLTVPATGGPITASVWITSALTAGGHYVPPETPGHVTDLGDGGPMVDSIVLMAVIQRHLLNEPRPGWADEELARDLNLNPQDIARTQNTLDRITQAIAHPAVHGNRWREPRDASDESGKTLRLSN